MCDKSFGEKVQCTSLDSGSTACSVDRHLNTITNCTGIGRFVSDQCLIDISRHSRHSLQPL